MNKNRHNKPKVLMMLGLTGVPGRGIARGIARYCRLHGPWDFHRLQSFYQDMTQGKKIILPPFKSWRPDGIIAHVDHASDAKNIIASGIPAIVTYVYQPIEGLINLISDNDTLGRMAADFFLDKKYVHFAYCGFKGIHWSDHRLWAFQDQVQAAGYHVHIFQQPRSKQQRIWENEKKHLIQWLGQLPKPGCLLAASDLRAMDVIEAAKEADINIPDQLAIMGVDNDEMVCTLNDPSITSISQCSERAGYEAAELLSRIMAGEKTNQDQVTIHAGQIIERQSTDATAIEDTEVAAAVRYIRQNAVHIHRVEEVADHVCLSLRQLQKRFAKALGIGISEEIRRVRMQTAATLLIETDWPISRIVGRIGYESYKNAARSFRKEMGMSLIEYRKAYSS